MTDKEMQSELKEKLSRKCGLSSKIEHNTKRIEILGGMIGRAKQEEKDYIYKEIGIGKALITVHKAERMKLSNRNIAQELGIKEHTVRREERIFNEVKL